MARVVPNVSAGILLYRRSPALQVLLGHMGGPFWRNRDAAAWSVPKGLIDPGEEPLAAALREFEEELGIPAPAVEYLPIGATKYGSGKTVIAYAAEADPDLSAFDPGTFEAEWPTGSGRRQSFPEIDRVEWFDFDTARRRLVKGQLPLLDNLARSIRNP